jgi:hypothetical protein
MTVIMEMMVTKVVMVTIMMRIICWCCEDTLWLVTRASWARKLRLLWGAKAIGNTTEYKHVGCCEDAMGQVTRTLDAQAEHPMGCQKAARATGCFKD